MEGSGVRVRVQDPGGGTGLRKGPEIRSPAGLGAPLQGSDGGMCEGPSRISGPIPPDPTLCPDYYRRPASGELEGCGVAGRGPREVLALLHH